MQGKKKQQNIYRALFNNQTNAIAVYEMVYNGTGEAIDFICIDGNELLDGIMGMDRRNYMNKKVSDVIPGFKESHKALFETYAEVAKTGGTAQFEYYSDIFNKWYSIKVYSHKKGYFATISDDITKQKKILHDIENAKKLNDTLIESSPFGILLFDNNGDCIIANEMAEKILGETKKQLSERNYHYIDSWKEGKIYENAQKTMHLGGKITGTELIKTYDGSQHWIEYFFVRMMYNDQPHLIFKFQDVSEKIKDQLYLKESEARYKTLFDENKSVMLLIDPNTGQIVDANQAALKYYGYSLKQIKKMSISQINILSDEEVKKEMKKVRTNRNNFFQFKHKLANGGIRNVQVYSGKIFIDNKELLYSIIHDNTNQIRAEEKLKQQTEELIQSEKMTALGTLIAGVTHELNNPLMGILNYTDYSLKHVPEDNKAYPVLKDLKEEAEKSADIVRGLLTFSRKGKVDIDNNYNTDLGQAIETVMKILSLKIKNKNIHVNFPKLNGIFYGNINNSYLQQILFNVLDNAIYAVENNEKREIQISVSEQIKHNTIYITDSGIGILPKDARNIFDPFFTTKPVGKGTGLGLSICKNILNDFGGDISFNSKPGEGTTFIIKIPMSNNN